METVPGQAVADKRRGRQPAVNLLDHFQKTREVDVSATPRITSL